jgi:hypothetical protein
MDLASIFAAFGRSSPPGLNAAFVVPVIAFAVALGLVVTMVLAWRRYAVGGPA